LQAQQGRNPIAFGGKIYFLKRSGLSSPLAACAAKEYFLERCFH
jgi:hypothetical protein